jgi:thiamine monophosphate synthase
LIAGLAVPVLVNDRLDVALAAGAAGVHLGPGDVPVEMARRLAPPGFVIGASVAVVSGILASTDIEAAARKYAESYLRFRSTIRGR